MYLFHAKVFPTPHAPLIAMTSGVSVAKNLSIWFLINAKDMGPRSFLS
jgi:hypothetical protein